MSFVWSRELSESDARNVSGDWQVRADIKRYERGGRVTRHAIPDLEKQTVEQHSRMVEALTSESKR